MTPIERAVSERDEQWKNAINRCSQPILCSGSDELRDKSPEEVVKIIHNNIVMQEYELVRMWRESYDSLMRKLK